MEESKLEEINKALDSCLNGNDCDLGRDKDCPYREKMFCCGCLKEDIQELLEKQKPIFPYQFEDIWKCGKCGNGVVQYEELATSGLETVRFDYCPMCGQAVKWE